MIRAYDQAYLEDSMKNLGEAMDCAVNTCHLKPDEFMDYFIVSGVAKQFEDGVPKYVVGMSGTELVCEVIRRSGKKLKEPETGGGYDCSPEYWCGWILAYYQWATGRSFQNIKRQLSMKELMELYPTLHEAPEKKFIDVIEKRMQSAGVPTRLQILRKSAGYSQKALAEKSGVALRMIQQYEQRAKDINKASATNLLALAKTLGCSVEDLME
ncbi:MAG: helix-turn-helix domain-containing protein [Lachnospiraceae bacterium]